MEYYIIFYSLISQDYFFLFFLFSSFSYYVQIIFRIPFFSFYVFFFFFMFLNSLSVIILALCFPLYKCKRSNYSARIQVEKVLKKGKVVLTGHRNLPVIYIFYHLRWELLFRSMDKNIWRKTLLQQVAHGYSFEQLGESIFVSQVPNSSLFGKFCINVHSFTKPNKVLARLPNY